MTQEEVEQNPLKWLKTVQVTDVKPPYLEWCLICALKQLLIKLETLEETMSLRQFHMWGNTIINECGTWADKTFPKATPETIMAHMQEEVDELTAAVDEHTDIGEETKAMIAEEMADVQLLLFHLAHKLNVDLPAATFEKFETNKKRKWSTKPEKEGHFKHIEND